MQRDADWLYIVMGSSVVLIVACIAQNIVHLVGGDHKTETANAGLCFFLCLLGLVSTMSTMESVGGAQSILVSTEEVIAYWYMVVYSLLRISSIAVGYMAHFLHSRVHPNRVVLTTAQSDTGKTNNTAEIIIKDNYYNLLTTVLQLIATRIHLSVPTPYTLGITGFIGVRLFLKMYKQVGDFAPASTRKCILTPPLYIPKAEPPHRLGQGHSRGGCRATAGAVCGGNPPTVLDPGRRIFKRASARLRMHHRG